MAGFEGDTVVGAIDVGSPKNIGWAVLDGEKIEHGSDLDAFVQCFDKLSIGSPAPETDSSFLDRTLCRF